MAMAHFESVVDVLLEKYYVHVETGWLLDVLRAELVPCEVPEWREQIEGVMRTTDRAVFHAWSPDEWMVMDTVQILAEQGYVRQGDITAARCAMWANLFLVKAIVLGPYHDWERVVLYWLGIEGDEDVARDCGLVAWLLRQCCLAGGHVVAEQERSVVAGCAQLLELRCSALATQHGAAWLGDQKAVRGVLARWDRINEEANGEAVFFSSPLQKQIENVIRNVEAKLAAMRAEWGSD